MGQKVPKNQTSRFLSYVKSFCILFCGKMTRYSRKFLKIRQVKLSTMSSLYVKFPVAKRLNIHKDFLNIWCLHAKFSVPKCSCTSISYTMPALKALLRKNWFYFYFLIFWEVRFPPSFWMPRYRHQFFIELFFKCFTFFKFTMPSQNCDNIFYIYPRSSSTEFSYNETASDLIMLWTIQR